MFWKSKEQKDDENFRKTCRTMYRDYVLQDRDIKVGLEMGAIDEAFVEEMIEEVARGVELVTKQHREKKGSCSLREGWEVYKIVRQDMVRKNKQQ